MNGESKMRLKNIAITAGIILATVGFVTIMLIFFYLINL